MKKVILSLAVLSSSPAVLVSTSAFAYSIPPSTISVRDLAAIFAESEILSRVGTKAIGHVALVAPSTYRVSTENCAVDVKVKDGSKPLPGFIGNGRYAPVVESYENQTCQ